MDCLLSFSLFCLSGFLGFGKWRWLLAALPLICIGFDFVENHHIHLLLQQYPTFDAETLRMASLGNTAEVVIRHAQHHRYVGAWGVGVGEAGKTLIRGIRPDRILLIRPDA
jgi:hypothetical protein